MIKKIVLLLSISLLFASAMIAQGDTATSTTQAKTTKSAAFRPNKDQITQGQKMLKDAKLFSGEATGVYSDDTRTAIKAYQKANGLTENGKFDKATLEKMGIALTDKQKGIVTPTATAKKAAAAPGGSSASKDGSTATATADGMKRPAPFRANKDQIASAQKMLRDGKMLTGGEDGKLDDVTREGLGKYQDANSLKVTKTLNAVTLEKMGIALTDKQKEQVAAQAAFDAAKGKN